MHDEPHSLAELRRREHVVALLVVSPLAGLAPVQCENIANMFGGPTEVVVDMLGAPLETKYTNDYILLLQLASPNL